MSVTVFLIMGISGIMARFLRYSSVITQTYENPNQIHPETRAKGDNDPLDVCEIGERVGYCGQVKQGTNVN